MDGSTANGGVHELSVRVLWRPKGILESGSSLGTLCRVLRSWPSPDPSSLRNSFLSVIATGSDLQIWGAKCWFGGSVLWYGWEAALVTVAGKSRVSWGKSYRACPHLLGPGSTHSGHELGQGLLFPRSLCSAVLGLGPGTSSRVCRICPWPLGLSPSVRGGRGLLCSQFWQGSWIMS